MTTQKSKQKINYYGDKNTVEARRDAGGSVAKSVAKDLGPDMVSDLWDQLLGVENPIKKAKGELQEGQEFDLSSLSKKQAKDSEQLHSYVEAAIDYKSEIIHVEKRKTQEDNHELQVKVEEIALELKKLVQTSKELRSKIRGASVEQRVTKPGKYHLAFFEWMVSMVRNARLTIENSASWLTAMQSKKQKRQYWNMFKKHGTTFGLSNERVVATQTG